MGKRPWGNAHGETPEHEAQNEGAVTRAWLDVKAAERKNRFAEQRVSEDSSRGVMSG